MISSPTSIHTAFFPSSIACANVPPDPLRLNPTLRVVLLVRRPRLGAGGGASVFDELAMG